MESNYSLADLAAVNDGGFGGNNIVTLLLLFALISGNGFFGNGRNNVNDYATAASQQEILSGQKFDALGRQINQVGDGLSSLGYSQLQQMDANTASINGNIVNEGRALQSQLASCCCENQRNTDALRYDISQMMATTNANISASNQKVLDALAQNKIEALQGQINALQLQNAVAGVVRYPMASTYSSGANPFCSCNCCGCAN